MFFICCVSGKASPSEFLRTRSLGIARVLAQLLGQPLVVVWQDVSVSYPSVRNFLHQCVFEHVLSDSEFFRLDSG